MEIQTNTNILVNFLLLTESFIPLQLSLDSVGYKTHLLLRYIIVEMYQEGWYIPKSHSVFYMIPKRAKTQVRVVMEL